MYNSVLKQRLHKTQIHEAGFVYKVINYRA